VGAFINSKSVIAILLFIALEFLVFQSGFYNAFVKPDSFAGMLMQRFDLAKSGRGNNTIALLGDSRLREGFSAQIFDQFAANNSLHALNLGLSGSDPRVWYYLLKCADTHCDAFKMIVIALPSYWDEDYSTQTADKRDDLQILLPILGFSDAIEFTQSVSDPCLQKDYLAALLWKMYGFRQDLKDLLAHPKERFQECKFFSGAWQETDYQYQGHVGSLAGARIVNNQIVGLPDSLSDKQRQRLQLTLLGLLEREPNGRCPYLRYWLGKLVTRYAKSPTKLVFVRIPSYPFAAQPVAHRHTEAVQAIARLPNVIVHPSNAFVFLEKPEYFFDDVHLNNIGRKIFSCQLSPVLLQYATSNAATVAQEHSHSTL
jgi:hypothetical protein